MMFNDPVNALIQHSSAGIQQFIRCNITIFISVELSQGIAMPPTAATYGFKLLH